jgi:succinate-semialdehyde dehydrogenase
MLHEKMNPAAGAISRNPASGELIATYPFQTPEEVERTLAAGAVAFQRWRATPMADRLGCYRRLAAKLRERSEAIALLVTSEMGKTIGSARAEVEKCAVALEWLAAHGPAILADEPVAVDNGDRVYVSFLPIGTVLAVMPWNFPLWQVVRAAGPIMLSGNGFLLKHASNVMGCAYALQEAYEASGFPTHLFANLNADKDVVATVIGDARIAAVTVTGSMRAGSAVAATEGRRSKRACSSSAARMHLSCWPTLISTEPCKLALRPASRTRGRFAWPPSVSSLSGRSRRSSPSSSCKPPGR